MMMSGRGLTELRALTSPHNSKKLLPTPDSNHIRRQLLHWKPQIQSEKSTENILQSQTLPDEGGGDQTRAKTHTEWLLDMNCKALGESVRGPEAPEDVTHSPREREGSTPPQEGVCPHAFWTLDESEASDRRELFRVEKKMC
ncbi:unnamed protein product [Pleuronectes platessa]|uniref:Uncharacterized protein n=1 Tax=Pleuronectes platessa TaxID=8262 RepID=A0A9N7UEJ5_PLEPL|nr:unnamed protein product [Pleuronectes platessa]